MPVRPLTTRPVLVTATALAFVLGVLLSSTAASAALSPRKQVAGCMRASHYQMPPTQTELSNPKFTPALQRCLTKAHITAYTAKQLTSYDSCLIKHHVTLGKTPHTSSTYQKAKAACRPILA